MSLSVDQLKRLEFVLSTDLGHHKNSGITPSWKLSKIADELQAIRELIAIKEAEPVAWALGDRRHSDIDVDMVTQNKNVADSWALAAAGQWEMIPIIFKPE